MADDPANPTPPPAAPTAPSQPPAAASAPEAAEVAALPAELAPVQAALDRGDNRSAGALLRALHASPMTPAVENAARALQSRLAPDSRALQVGLAALLLLAFIVVHYVF
jgi:hypothetical protein